MRCIYIWGELSEDCYVKVPVTSAAVVFVLKYCQTDVFTICFVKPATDSTVGFENANLKGLSSPEAEKICLEGLVRIPISSVSSLSPSFIQTEEVPDEVNNCVLPVIQSYGSNLVRCGLCCCVRHIIHESHKKNHSLHLQDLLVSGWTKLCEVELPHTITDLMKTWRSSEGNLQSVAIPEDVMKLELHFEKPPPLHNDDKIKRAVVKDLQARKDDICNSNKDFNNLIREFFKNTKEQHPHGSIQYRVITKIEREQRKYNVSKDDSVCKLGCTEKRLVKWCARCNDKEKLRQKEKQLERNMARLHITDESNSNVTSRETPGRTDNLELIGIKSVEELRDYIDELTLNEIEYEHLYAEGITLTLADLLLYTYMYFLLTSEPHLGSQLLLHLPHVKKWLLHLVALPRIQLISCQCGFSVTDLEQCLKCESLPESKRVQFSIPQVSLDVEEEENEISRRSRGKHKALKKEIARVLNITEDANLVPHVGPHPRGCNVQVNWESVPSGAHPRDELPEKRVGKKCEQLENLATAVESLAKPGDVIVDFCSGGGHLGIIIAYLLPQCKVYLIENKEESLMRAKQRVEKLNMKNVTLYQCNMGYFEGDFNIGVCLHACGVATDMVLQQCIQRQAAFVICPCCYGSIRNTHLITYPRSQCYRETTLTDKDVIILGHAADQTEFETPLLSQGRHCMNLVDMDRALVAMEHGYQVTLCSLQPLTCTPKNNLLIGKPPE